MSDLFLCISMINSGNKYTTCFILYVDKSRGDEESLGYSYQNKLWVATYRLSDQVHHIPCVSYVCNFAITLQEHYWYDC